MQLEVTVQEIGKLEDAMLVDIRTTGEVAREPLTCKHIHIPMDQLLARPQLLSKDRSYVLVCAAGIRTRTTAVELRSLGYTVYSLVGGNRMLESL